MKFQCMRSVLYDAISTASRAVSLKSTIPALEGLMIRAGDALTVTGYNLDLGIVCTPEASVARTGSAVFNAATFLDIVQKLPEDMVFIEMDEGYRVSVRCGLSRFTFSAMPGDEFPELPVLDGEASFELSSSLLRDMIVQTVFSTAVTDAKPVLTGVLFDLKGSTMRLVASDSSRMAVREETAGFHDADAQFIVPGGALREAERVLKRDDSPVTLILAKKHLILQAGETTLITRLLEGAFINYEPFLSAAYSHDVTVDRAQFSTSVSRMDVKNSDKIKNAIKCSFADGVIQFHYLSSRVTGYDECPYTGDCEPMEIGLANRFVSDALHAIDEETVRLCFNTATSPFVIKPVEGSRYSYIIAPCRT